MMRYILVPATLVSLAITASAQVKRHAPKIEGCATVGQMIAAEAYNRGHDFRSARIFRDGDAQWLASQIGMAFPGADTVVLFSYSDGSVGVASLVGDSECWRLNVLERRK